MDLGGTIQPITEEEGSLGAHTVCVSRSVVPDSAIPWTAANQAPVHGIFQATILEWAAISCSRGFSRPRD